MNEKIYTTYAQDTDITFIMKDTIIDNKLMTTEVIGFYYGEPDGVNTEQYLYNLKATFENGLELDTMTLKQYLIDSKVDQIEDDAEFCEAEHDLVLEYFQNYEVTEEDIKHAEARGCEVEYYLND